MAAKGAAQSARDPLEVVGIARHDEIGARKRPGNYGRVHDVARAGARANDAGRTRTRLVEILDDAAMQKAR